MSSSWDDQIGAMFEKMHEMCNDILSSKDRGTTAEQKNFVASNASLQVYLLAAMHALLHAKNEAGSKIARTDAAMIYITIMASMTSQSMQGSYVLTSKFIGEREQQLGSPISIYKVCFIRALAAAFIVACHFIIVLCLKRVYCPFEHSSMTSTKRTRSSRGCLSCPGAPGGLRGLHVG